MTPLEKTIADDKMRAELTDLLAETTQVGVSTFLVPFLAAAGLMAVTAGVTLAITNLFVERCV
jgi:hypothetical protein